MMTQKTTRHIKPKLKSKRSIAREFSISMSHIRNQHWRMTSLKSAEMYNQSRIKMFSRARYPGGTNLASYLKEISWTLPVYLRLHMLNSSSPLSLLSFASFFSKTAMGLYKVCKTETVLSSSWPWQSLLTRSKTSFWSSPTSALFSLEKWTTICTRCRLISSERSLLKSPLQLSPQLSLVLLYTSLLVWVLCTHGNSLFSVSQKIIKLY